MTCPWCIGSKCRVTDEENCDFKSLPMDKELIKKRIDEEFYIIGEAMKEMKKSENEEDTKKYMGMIYDKLMGMKVMREMLSSKFGISYFPKGRIEFMKLVIDVNKHMRQFK
jgi:hypothetical protein